MRRTGRGDATYEMLTIVYLGDDALDRALSLDARGAAAAAGTGMMRQLGYLSNNRGDWLVDFQLSPNPVGMPEDWVEQATRMCQKHGGAIQPSSALKTCYT
jgi:hypothetical protein